MNQWFLSGRISLPMLWIGKGSIRKPQQPSPSKWGKLYFGLFLGVFFLPFQYFLWPDDPWKVLMTKVWTSPDFCWSFLIEPSHSKQHTRLDFQLSPRKSQLNSGHAARAESVGRKSGAQSFSRNNSLLVFQILSLIYCIYCTWLNKNTLCHWSGNE